MQDPTITVFAGGPGVEEDGSSGCVLSMDAERATYEAIAVRSGVIVAAGSLKEVSVVVDCMVQDAAGTEPVVEWIDLAGRVVLPGINDSHLHATWLGARWPSLLFSGESPGEAPTSPLCTSRAQRRAAILRAGRLLAEVGITSYTEPGIGPGEDDGETGCFGSEVESIYRELSDEGLLRQRVTVLGLHGVLDGPSDAETVVAGLTAQAAADGGDARTPNHLIRTGVKIFADLIPMTCDAWTRHEYVDGTHGRLLIGGADSAEREANLRRIVGTAQRVGQQVGVHATGDRAVEAVLAELETFDVGEVRALSHSIIHGDLATADQVRRMAELGVWLNVQSGIAVTAGELMRRVLPARVVDDAWPIGEALAVGNLVLSSDSPVLGFDWRVGIADAEELLRRRGQEPDRYELLRSYTAVPSRQDQAASWKGTLNVGKVADLVLLSGDPRVGELRDVEVEATYLGGQLTWAKDAAVRRAADLRRRAGSHR